MPTESEMIKELWDRQQILDVIYTYASAIDQNDFERMAACFTEDASWDYGPESGPPMIGSAAIQRLVKKAYSKDALEEGGVKIRHGKGASHHVSTVLIRFDGPDLAQAESYVHTWHEMNDDPQPGLVWGRWYDTLRRTPDGWRICGRQMRLAGSHNYPAIGYPVIDPSRR